MICLCKAVLADVSGNSPRWHGRVGRDKTSSLAVVLPDKFFKVLVFNDHFG